MTSNARPLARSTSLAQPPPTAITRLGRRRGRGAAVTRVIGVLVGSTMGLAALTVPAQAETQAVQHFVGAMELTNADGQSQPVWSVVAANGVVNDVGTVRFGQDDAVIHQDLFVLSRGTIILTEPSDPTTDVFRFDPTTCVGSDTATGTYQMTGTGRYASVTGQGTYRHQATIVAPYKPGCSPGDAGTVGYVVFAASGPASSGG